MGNLPESEDLIIALKNAGIPFLVASSVMEQNKEYQSLSTVETEDYQKIFRYINYGGKKNFESLLLYLANRFTGASFEVEAPEQPCWEGIYHPDFDYIPSLEEYLEKKVKLGCVTVGIWFHLVLLS